MDNTATHTCSPLDGRYQDKCKTTADHFSEFALVRKRVEIELRWLICIAELLSTACDNSALVNFADNLISNFTLSDFEKIKKYEATTRHDIKAVEYYLRDKLNDVKLKHFSPLIHFACTSDDINNLAYASLIQSFSHEVLFLEVEKLLTLIYEKSKEWQSEPMLAHTHGQPASPTTAGKEFAVYFHRLNRSQSQIEKIQLQGKCNGATGNYNAHITALPDIDWPQVSGDFVTSLGLEFNPLTTQIENHDSIVELCINIRRFNAIAIGLCQDVWTYLSMKYFHLGIDKGSVGSSVMPHKINPIQFENAEGNFKLANAIFDCLSDNLSRSRMQRDLVDSTLQRNYGVAFGHTMLALQSLQAGLRKLSVNRQVLQSELDCNWQVLGEAIQTLLRKHGHLDAYEQLKALTQGADINKLTIHEFIETLSLPNDEKNRLKQLTPQNYIGLAEQLTGDVPI